MIAYKDDIVVMGDIKEDVINERKKIGTTRKRRKN